MSQLIRQSQMLNSDNGTTYFTIYFEAFSRHCISDSDYEHILNIIEIELRKIDSDNKK
jgi:hypothetical protein